MIRVADMINNVQKEDKASFQHNYIATNSVTGSSLEKKTDSNRKNVVETLEENNKNIAKVLENYENLCKVLDIESREIGTCNNTQSEIASEPAVLFERKTTRERPAPKVAVSSIYTLGPGEDEDRPRPSEESTEGAIVPDEFP